MMKERKNGSTILGGFKCLSVADNQKFWHERNEKQEKSTTEKSTDDKNVQREEEAPAQSKTKTSSIPAPLICQRKRNLSLFILYSSSSSDSTSNTITPEKENEKSAENNPDPPTKKIRQVSPQSCRFGKTRAILYLILMRASRPRKKTIHQAEIPLTLALKQRRNMPHSP